MYVDVYVDVCMYMYVHVVCTCMPVDVCMYMFVYTCNQEYIITVSLYILDVIHVCMFMYVHVCIYMYLCMVSHHNLRSLDNTGVAEFTG